MMNNCSVARIGYANISHNVTIVPRLEYSNALLKDIIGVLKKKRGLVKKENHVILGEFDSSDKTCMMALETEKTIVFSIEILSQIQKKASMISGITDIPEVLSPAIPLLRTISAQLYEVLLECSQKLSEISVHMGSIVLDSAALTKARFDFSLSNEESTILLDKVKLMVDSKISKQYPNLDFLKP